MYAQGSYNSQSGQGARTAGLPPYQQLPLPPPPRLSHNFQEISQVALRPGQPGMPLYQRGPPAPQVPQLQNPYLHAPPAARGSFTLPHMYNPSLQNSQQNSQLAPGILASRPALPAVSNSLNVTNVPLPAKGLLPTPSPGKMMYGAPVHQLPLQKPGVVQAPQNVLVRPSPPPNIPSGSSKLSCVTPLPPSSSLPKPEEANSVRKIDNNSSVRDQVATGSNLSSDSDMEMEDDITQPDNDHAINQSIEGQNNTYRLVSDEFDIKGELPAPKNSADSHALVMALPNKVLVYGSLGSGEQGLDPDHLTSGRATSGLHGPVTNSAEAAECPSASNDKDITNTGFDNKEPLTTSAADCSNSFGLVIESGNLFKHSQNHASDESCSGKDANLGLKESCPQTKSSLVAVGAESLIRSAGTSSGSEIAHKTEKGLAEELLSEPITSQGTREPLPDTQRVVKEAVSTSITSGSTESSKDEDHVSGCATHPKDFSKENASGSALVNVASSGKSQKEKIDETAITSTAQRIDKYGRLVREGATDSDSDDSQHVARHNRRRKSRSRSRSPVDRRRRRSPRRRRAKRSRSRSWSPMYRRSRSRSPSWRHVGKFSSGNMRRDKRQLSDCFDFLRGRCYRGASCRYLHHDSEKIDGPRRDRGKLRVPSKNPTTQEETKKLSVKVSEDEISQKMQSSKTEPPSSIHKKEQSGDYAAHFQGTMGSDKPLVADNSCPKLVGDTAVLKLQIEASQNTIPYLKDSVIQQSQPGNSNPVVAVASHAMQQTDDASVSDSSLGKTSSISQNNLPVSETIPTLTTVHNASYLSTPHPALISELSTPSVAVQSQSTPAESFPSYALPGQNSRYSVPPNNSWSSLPPKASLLPPYNPGTTTQSVSLQFQQISLPSKNDIGSQRPYSAELPGPSQVVESQHLAHPQMQQNFSQAQNYHQPATFSGNSVPSGDTLNSSSQFHPHFQQQQPFFSLHHVRPDRVYGPAGIMSSCRYPMDGMGMNQPAHLPEFELSTKSAQYNPYEQPHGSKLSSDVLKQEKEKACSGKDDHSSDGGFAGVGSVNPTKGAGQNFPGSGGDQYDPLLDSIEQPPNSSKKFDHIQKWEPSKDSDKVLRYGLRGFNKPLDVEENNKNKETGVAVATSVDIDNEEFGETADAEVGDVENFSHGNDNAVENLDDGEMEVDQFRSPGKTNKSKESRSMKLFKVALANFVKDVLKPSWRQGNMSKEAFKTVVKKTVDKVSGAMKSHQIPKSKAKIEQYINSSQRKLTKLVMGYVDKYAKG